MDKGVLEIALQDKLYELHCDIYLTVTFRAKAVTESAEKSFKYLLSMISIRIKLSLKNIFYVGFFMKRVTSARVKGVMALFYKK